jgi:peptidoglycan/xylan/chitin deacetylase (PgdA/CDA1 family)
VIRRRRAVVLLVGVLFIAVGVATELGGGSGHAQAAHAGPTKRALRSLAAGVSFDQLTRTTQREARAIENVRRRVPFVSAGGRRHRLVALTFDDGPGPYTGRVVRALRRLGVRATFFQVGQMIAAFPGVARRVRRHFPVGDHTLSHPQMAMLAEPVQRNEIVADAERLRAVGAGRPLLFRPPYASFDLRTLEVVRQQGMLMVLWNVDSADWTRPGTRQIVRNVVSRVRPGAVVLMHDAGGDRRQTVAALPAIVHRLRRRGYRFVTVPRMLLEAPPRSAQRLPRGAQFARRH